MYNKGGVLRIFTEGKNEKEPAAEKTHLQKAKEYQAEHNCGITEALLATATKRQ